MEQSRREFIERLGIALGSLVLLRCGPAAEIERRLGLESTEEPKTPRERVRQAWLSLPELAETTQDWDDQEASEELRLELLGQHRIGLDELVAAGELEEDVARRVQRAYSAAAYHIWRANAPITCYEPVEIDYVPSSSSQLAYQANLLNEMAETSDLDPETVAEARAAIERDIAFLSLSGDERQALYDQLLAEAKESNQGIPPAFGDVELAIAPVDRAAADFLIELLLDQGP